MPTQFQKIKSLARKIYSRADRYVARLASLQHAPKYAYASLFVLLATTVFWSILGGSVHQSNADQIVNSYLFSGNDTFHNSQLPGAHTFLIKWPLFYLVDLFRSSSGALLALTIIAATLTVGFMALIIYRIEKRPLVFGTICLALASVLLMVPAEPMAGTLLPLNMAMLATRNLEYILFIFGLVLIFRSPRIRSRSFYLGVITLGVLMASDKLFLTLGAGGALIALIIYSLAKGWSLVSLSANWLVGTVLAYLVGLTCLWAIQTSKLVHIIGQSNASPYSIVTSIHALVLGVIYGLSALFTNFGANPAYDTSVLKNVPSASLHRLFSVSGPAYIINFLILIVIVVAIWKLIQTSLKHNKDGSLSMDLPAKLSTSLIWISLAGFISFVASKHYYAADARYLTIFLFTGFFAATTVFRKVNLDSKKLVWAGVVLVAAIGFGIASASGTYRSEMKSTSELKSRDILVSKALSQHTVNSLVGDYWRVVPARVYIPKSINVLPLSSCTSPRTILTSTSWQRDLSKVSFAYLLNLEKSQTDFPSCTLDQIIAAYGRPNASALIAGTQDSPQEILLFYDKGANSSSPNVVLKTPSTILPVPLSELPYTSCPTGKTIMNISAHQDDDLLFMNPDTLHSLQAGDCIRAVYLTAGDAGNNQLYWLGREQGSEAAYATMEATDNIWVKRIVRLNDKEFINASHPRGDYKTSIIFFRLPDGNLKGQGFRQYLYESLAQLNSGKISSLTSVDGQSTYTKDQLVSALSELMKVYGVSEVRTQSSYVSKQYPDHSDHIASGQLATLAKNLYEKNSFENTIPIPIHFYTGYPVREQPANISGSDLIAKEAIFLSYAKFDKSVCQNHVECSGVLTYGSYLSRQYEKPN